MQYETIQVKESLGRLTITIDRPEQRNSINDTFLKEINEVLDLAEQDSNCRVVLLEGQNGVFCTGMDFEKVTQEAQVQHPVKTPQVGSYMETIRRFTLTPRVIISIIDGEVMAGGVGLAAASDLAIATPRSRFSLSEALWGLIPAMVTPYLIRRVGFQAAYRMTLTTLAITAQEAWEAHLIDEISETPQDNVQRWWLRLSKLEETTIKTIKQFFRNMWIINRPMEEMAVNETARLSSDPGVIENIVNYVKYQKFPWDK